MIINRMFLDFIYANCEGKKVTIYIATVCNGVCMALMMLALSQGLERYGENGQVPIRPLLMFALALGAYYVTQALGGRIVSTAALKGLGDLELRVMNKLRMIDYEAFQTLDPELIYAAVGGDKYGAVMAARFIIPTMSAMVVVALTGLYLCTVSVPGALIVAGTLVFVIRIRAALDANITARKREDAIATDRFTVSLRDVVEGFNELKMNQARSDALFASKIQPSSRKKNIRLLGTELYQMRSIVLEQATLFLPLGLTAFVLPLFFQPSAADLVKIISVTLIVIWPAYTLVQIGPVSSAAAGIVERLSTLEVRLTPTELPEAQCAPAFEHLACERIEYRYPDADGDDRMFKLKAASFALTRGEMVIMRGGNGSGKSTFMRILAGLAPPTSGEISVNGTPVSHLGEAHYRAMFSIVMTDFHLFDQFCGYGDIDPEQLRRWVGMLGLGSKVNDIRNLPTTSLSSGQKKRMALLAAILENRQILLLDEVAADFDPQFREAYYRQVLPALKQDGRTLFVISHDDRYYDIADRVLTMREGAIVEE